MIDTFTKSKRWSQKVTENSHALNFEKDVFKLDDPAQLARSLKRSAEASTQNKSSPFRSAMSMLTFYINRAGKHLSARRKNILNEAKVELRKLFSK